MSETLIDSTAPLVSRFNAHMTFNVLNTIQGFLLEKDTDAAMELILCYSRLLHKMLLNGRWEIPLREEIDPQLHFLIVPKSLLVSFVENAVSATQMAVEVEVSIYP